MVIFRDEGESAIRMYRMSDAPIERFTVRGKYLETESRLGWKSD